MKEFINKKIFGPNYRWWALWVVVLAVFMSTTDVGLLTISLPVIITEFNADMALAGWIVFIYALVTGSLYLPSGRMSDLIGRKKSFCTGFLIYAVSSAIAGLSQGPGQLICFRALQAVGSSLMMANTFALTTALFPAEERGRALGLGGSMVAAFGFTLGPVLGGLITHTLGWRFVFYVTAVLGIIGFCAARLLLLEEQRDLSDASQREPFDFIGAVAFAIGLSFLLLALTMGQKGLWHSWIVQGEFLIAFFSLGFFIWWETRTRYPLLDLKLFRIMPFAAGNVARLASFIALSTNELMMPFYLQLGLALNPLKSGFLMTPTAVGLAVLSPLSGWLSDKLGTSILASSGVAIMAVAFYSLSFLRIDSSFADVVFRLGLLGLGLGLFQTPNNNSLMGSIPANRLGVASSFISVVRSVGRSVGTAMATAIVSANLLAATGQTSLAGLGNSSPVDGNSDTLSAFMQGYRYAYTTAGVLCLVGIGASLMRGPKPEEKQDP